MKCKIIFSQLYSLKGIGSELFHVLHASLHNGIIKYANERPEWRKNPQKLDKGVGVAISNNFVIPPPPLAGAHAHLNYSKWGQSVPPTLLQTVISFDMISATTTTIPFL